MTNEEAWLYAASWGSYNNSGDPGACMYGFSEDFTVQSENHRAACIKWMTNCRAYAEANPRHYDDDELDKIDALIEKLKLAELGRGGDA